MPKVTRQQRTTKKTAKKSSVTSRIVALDDIVDHGIKICIYGKSGSGKTRMLGTFSVLGKLLHIVCSSNKMNEARSIKGYKNVEVVDLQEPEELPELIDYARDNDFASVGLDHVTDFCGLVLSRLVGVERMPEQSSWGLASQQQYAQMGFQVKEYLRGLLDLECNVILTGQERVYNTTEDGGDVVMPFVSVAATPSIAGWITPACDYVCQTFKRKQYVTKTKKIGGKTKTTRTDTGKVEYCLRTGPDETYMTKFRVPPGTELPDVVADPSYEKIAPLVSGV